MSKALRSYAARSEHKDRATAYRFIGHGADASFERGYYLGRAHVWHEVVTRLDVEQQAVAKGGRVSKRPKRPVARRAGNKKRAT